MPATIKTPGKSLVYYQNIIDEQIDLLNSGSEEFDEIMLRENLKAANFAVRRCAVTLKGIQLSPQRFDSANVQGLLDGLTPISK